MLGTIRAVAGATVFMLSCAAFAAPVVQNASPWDVARVHVREVANDTSYAHPGKMGTNSLNIANDCSQVAAPMARMEPAAVDWVKIVNLGLKIWGVIEKGRPVVHVEAPVAHALPSGLNCWADLEHWSAPTTRSFEVAYENGFGMEVVKFRFRLHYTAGGGKGPVGKYLANVSVMPAEVSVSWGYNFDARVEVGQALNMGTAVDPLAGLELNLIWSVNSMMKAMQNSVHFFVRGDGTVQVVE